jgi:choline-glycine betaine transporter
MNQETHAMQSKFKSGRVVYRLMPFVLALLIVAACVTSADACPTCKVALASHDKAHGDLVSGFFWSILFLLSMPFVLLGSFSTYCYLLVRKARAQAAGEASRRELEPTSEARVASELTAV